MARFHITIKGQDPEAMRDLVRVHHISVYDHGIERDPSGVYTVHASAEQADIDRLTAAGYRVERGEALEQLGKQRQREVGKGDRYRRKGT